jgi:hypothetical protein
MKSQVQELFLNVAGCHQPVQAVDFAFQLAAPAIVIDLFGVMLLPLPVVGGLSDALFATNVGDRQSVGQVVVAFAQ